MCVFAGGCQKRPTNKNTRKEGKARIDDAAALAFATLEKWGTNNETISAPSGWCAFSKKGRMKLKPKGGCKGAASSEVGRKKREKN